MALLENIKLILVSPCTSKICLTIAECVDEGVGLYSQHNLHHADDMQIYKQRNADLQYVVVFRLNLPPIYCSQKWYVK